MSTRGSTDASHDKSQQHDRAGQKDRRPKEISHRFVESLSKCSPYDKRLLLEVALITYLPSNEMG
jgi:hypothetical protein